MYFFYSLMNFISHIAFFQSIISSKEKTATLNVKRDITWKTGGDANYVQTEFAPVVSKSFLRADNNSNSSIRMNIHTLRLSFCWFISNFNFDFEIVFSLTPTGFTEENVFDEWLFMKIKIQKKYWLNCEYLLENRS